MVSTFYRTWKTVWVRLSEGQRLPAAAAESVFMGLSRTCSRLWLGPSPQMQNVL